ncbi:MAG: nucleotidyl transferase AbiEii/AbiGii toxin family protein [Planctomycetia bacterium]|nr:nucleotidyl transferase AbiEii/AbiGii toxin family protein [Planctomycetia bacterium]
MKNLFKGARILSLRLGGGRQSLDLDANLRTSFIEQFQDRNDLQRELERAMVLAIRRRFDEQDPVRFELTRLRVTSHPPQSHPLGWDAFVAKLSVEDRTQAVRGLPAIALDLAAPEELRETSVGRIKIGGHEVHAYTLERIAGEKLRAFLSSLPTYLAKKERSAGAVRAKDLYDISRIRQARGLQNEEFWHSVGLEFKLACKSRYVDCDGLSSFHEQWDVTRRTYSAGIIPSDISFDEVEKTIDEIVEFFARVGIIPFQFPMPRQGKT